jgi:hypothetical protein
MDTVSNPVSDDPDPEPGAEESAPALPKDPRVPRPEDAEPTRSKELGGAAPAVGPKTDE